MARSDMQPVQQSRGLQRLRGGRIVLGAGALALPIVIACNGITGLSDFEKTECPGARCEGEDGLPDVFVEGGPDVIVDGGPDVKGADPVSWAQWPMPNYGEGGAGSPPRPPSLTSPGAGDIVTDNVTKLVWRSTLLPEVTSADAADTACRNAPNGPWRAPKRIELVTLLDYSKKGAPYIDSTKFTGIINDVVWTTSEVRPLTSSKADQRFWVVDFTNGSVSPQPALNFKADVLCVRAK